MVVDGFLIDEYLTVKNERALIFEQPYRHKVLLALAGRAAIE